MAWLRSSLSVAVVFLLCFGPALYLLGVGWLGPESRAEIHRLPWTAYVEMLRHSLFMAGGTTLVAVGIGLPLSLALFKIRWPGRNFIRLIALATTAIPLYFYAAAWLGAWPQYQRNLPELVRGVWPGLGLGLGSGILVSGFSKTILATFLFGVILWAIPPEAEETAWLDARRRSVLWNVDLRYLFRGIILVGAIIFGLAANEIAVTDMLNIRTLAEEAYVQFQLTLQPSVAVTAGLSAFIPILLPWLALVWTSGARSWTGPDPLYQKESSVFHALPGWIQWLAGMGAIAAILVLMGIPVVLLGRTLARSPGAMGLLLNAKKELLVSMGVGGAASLLAVLAAFPLSYRGRGRREGAFNATVALAALFVPGSIAGIALVSLLNRPIFDPIYSSPIILVLTQALRVFPIALIVLSVFLRDVPKVYDDLAALDQAGAWSAFTRIYAPICAAPLFWSWAIAWVWCLGELDASIITCPPGLMTLPIRVFTLMHYGVYGEVAAACLLQAGAVLFIISLLFVFRALKSRKISHSHFGRSSARRAG